MVKLLPLLGLVTYVTLAYATKIHVNKGCILIDDKPICAGATYSKGSGHVVIQARYDGNNKNKYSTPGCVKGFDWPTSYGDVYYGSDNCLYDSDGDNIEGQCCNAKSGLDQTVNPYV